MKRLILVLFVLLLIGGIGGVGFLATRTIPAPTKTVEKVIPNDHFPE